MTKYLGNDRQLFIGDGGGSEVFASILGQRNLAKDGAMSKINLSDKNSGPYGLSGPGRIDLSITLDVVLDLPDVTGFEVLFAKYKARAPWNFQIRQSPYTTGDVFFACQMYVLKCSESDPMDGEVTYSIELGAAAAPTVDELTA